MAIVVALNHKTIYRYDRPVRLGPQVVRLRPAPHCRTPIHAYSLRVSPGDHFINWQQDPFANYQARLTFPKPTSELSVEVDLVAELVVIDPFDFFVEEYAEKLPFRYEPALALELAPYLERLPLGPGLAALIEEVHARVARPGRRSIDVLVDINREIQQIG